MAPAKRMIEVMRRRKAVAISSNAEPAKLRGSSRRAINTLTASNTQKATAAAANSPNDAQIRVKKTLA